MKRIHYENMQEYGISYTTAEACGLSMRVLYTLNEQAWKYALEFFGLHPDTPANPFPDSASTPERYSTLMLAPGAVAYLLAYLVIRITDAKEIMFVPQQSDNISRREMTIYVPEDEYDKDYDRMWDLFCKNSNMIAYRYAKSNQPGNGFRNRHWFSGRLQ